jgi:hypothetical protein
MRSIQVIVLIVTSLAFRVADALTLVSGPIQEIWVNDSAGSNVAWVRLTTSFSTPCGTSNGYMVMDLDAAGMREAYAMALSAFVSGINVQLGGSGACHANYEKIKFVYLVR